MTKRIVAEEMLITKLSDEDRKSVEERLNMLRFAMQMCQGYLHDYMAGNQNAFKFLNSTSLVHGEIQETAKLLMGLYGLPGGGKLDSPDSPFVG